MTSLLAIVLATHAEPGQPTLTFAWPPRPRPIPRLDRPVYKREQALAGEALPPSSKRRRRVESRDRGLAHDGDAKTRDLDEDDLTGMRYIRGLRAREGSSSEEEDAPRHVPATASARILGNGQRPSQDAVPPGEDEDALLAPTSFYRHRSTTRSASRERGDLDPPGDGGEKYLGLAPETWGGILTPRDGHGKKLEVVIDALAIIGHPVRIKQSSSPAKEPPASSRERGRSRTRVGGSMDSSGSEEVAHDKLVESTTTTTTSPPPAPPVSQLTRMLAPSPLRDRQPSPGALPRPSSEILAPPSSPHLPFDYSPFAPASVSSTEASGPPPDASPTDEARSPIEDGGMTSFTLALVIDTPPASHLSEHLDVYYQDVVVKLTAALKRLERLDGYVSREAALCRAAVSSPPGSSTVERRYSSGEMLEQREKASALAQELAVVFEDVKDFGHATATFDGKLDLEVLLHQELFEHHDEERPDAGVWERGLEVQDPVRPEGEVEGKYAHVQSWKTLLPLVDDMKLLAAQTTPGSLLYRFIDSLTPSATLEEFQALLDIDGVALAEMVDHLVYWRKAKLVDVVSVKSIYQIAPSSRPRGVGLFHDFARDFPGFPPLPSILSRLSLHARPFSTVLPSFDPTFDRVDSQAVLVWLLRNDLVNRLRTYVRIIARPTIKRRARARIIRTRESQSEADEESVRDPTSPELEARSLPKFEPANDSPVEIRFSSDSGTAPAPLNGVTPGDSGFSLHPHRYPSGSSTSMSTSVGAFGGSPVSASPHALSLDPAGQRRQHRRWRQRSGQSAKSEDSSVAAGSDSHATGTTEDDDEEPSIVADPARASGIERAWLDELSRDKREPVKGDFGAVMRYFDGTFPVEEIISRTGVGRRGLKAVLAEYEADLVLLMHP